VFTYTRSFNDTTETGINKVKDVYTNEGLVRTVNGEEVELSERKATAYGNSVNSVLYFVQLPYGLNDAAVIKELLGTVTVKGQPYYKVKVTFQAEGGGTDFEDVFIYWINQESYRVAYLAYLFHVNEGGIRFREAYNQRTINGLVFSDYVNYEVDEKQYTVEEADQLFEAGKLKELSRIVSERGQVVCGTGSRWFVAESLY